MGTRGLLGHFIRAQKKGSYNNKDSYPTGLGINVVKFILSLSEEQIETMREMVEGFEWYHIPISALPLLLETANTTQGRRRTHPIPRCVLTSEDPRRHVGANAGRYDFCARHAFLRVDVLRRLGIEGVVCEWRLS